MMIIIKPFLSNKGIRFVFLMSVLLVSRTAPAQLSGSYTLGDNTCDFSTFDDAINAINTLGLAGNTLFLVKPGVYYYVTVNNVQNDSSYRISFVYDGTENDSAVLKGQLHIHNSPFVTFKGFTLYPAAGQDYSALYLDKTPYCTIDSCKILNLYNNEFDYSQGLIYLKYEWSGPYIVDSIVNSVISSEHRAFCMEGKKGVFILKNSRVTGGLRDTYGSIHKRYYNNTFYCTEDEFSSTSQGFYYNEFYPAGVSNINIKAKLTGNRFHQLSLNISSGTVINNSFEGSVQMFYCKNADVTGNVFYGTYESVFSHGIMLRNNVFHDNVTCNNDNTRFGNNIVFDTVRFTHGPGQIISNNNFYRKAFLQTDYTGGILINNNLANVFVLQEPVWRVENNNFVNLGNGNVNFYGSNAHFYNPMYDSNLRATNPLLTGKGKKAYSWFRYDIDSVLRKNPPTIGANEVCFNWLPPELDLPCSDSIKLDMCTDSLGDRYWAPSYLFDDTLSPEPVIYPEDTVTVYLRRLHSGGFDSLRINVVKTAPPVPDVDYETEGLTVRFQNRSLCAGTFFWRFGDGDTSNDKEPVHLYDSTGSYTCIFSAENEIGTSFDTLNIILTTVTEPKNGGNEISVYPNPAGEYLWVQSQRAIRQLEVFNVRGEKLLSEESLPANRYRLDVSALKRGVYYLKVTCKKVTCAVKFVK